MTSERTDIAGTLDQCASELNYAAERLIKGEDSIEDILIDLQDVPETTRRMVDELEALREEEEEEEEEEGDDDD